MHVNESNNINLGRLKTLPYAKERNGYQKLAIYGLINRHDFIPEMTTGSCEEISLGNVASTSLLEDTERKQVAVLTLSDGRDSDSVKIILMKLVSRCIVRHHVISERSGSNINKDILT